MSIISAAIFNGKTVQLRLDKMLNPYQKDTDFLRLCSAKTSQLISYQFDETKVLPQ